MTTWANREVGGSHLRQTDIYMTMAGLLKGPWLCIYSYDLHETIRYFRVWVPGEVRMNQDHDTDPGVQILLYVYLIRD